MNLTQLTNILESLDDSVWQALLLGQPLLLIDDERVVAAAESSGKIFIPPQQAKDISSLRDSVIADAEEHLNNYYLSHPLSQTGFDRQVEKLVEQYGASAFAAVYPDVSERTLFVDVGEVIAEGHDSPRHPYGAYCELEELLEGDALQQFVLQWIADGEAYERYISMNVCRYGCIKV